VQGKGGRSLEIALSAARELDGDPGVALLAAGSDGRDGSSRAAGAIAEGSTLRRARRLGLDPRRALRRHDTEPFFARAGGLFRTGPTGTNVADWAFGVRV
jgi:hydroxypyruvate reductase